MLLILRNTEFYKEIKQVYEWAFILYNTLGLVMHNLNAVNFLWILSSFKWSLSLTTLKRWRGACGWAAVAVPQPARLLSGRSRPSHRIWISVSRP